MKRIPLSQGKYAIVDDADYNALSCHGWHAVKHHNVFYAARSAGRGKPMIRMHRIILNAPKHLQVDHINGDGLDNRRSNLRLCTHAQNQRNKTRRTDCKSRFKGVVRHLKYDYAKPWHASITKDRKYHHLGYYATEEEAAIAYDLAAIRLHGAFARLNFKGEEAIIAQNNRLCVGSAIAAGNDCPRIRTDEISASAQRADSCME